MTTEMLQQLIGLIGEVEDYEKRRYEKSAWSLFAEDESEQARRVAHMQEIGKAIEQVPDSIVRRALKLRYVDGLPWCMVAARMGYQSEAGPRLLCGRYLTKTG